jgi:hypothetical protein
MRLSDKGADKTTRRRKPLPIEQKTRLTMINAKYLAPFALAVTLVLGACTSSGQWQTSYNDVINPAVSKNWRVVKVDVRVPETLSVSEKNSYAPNADIVWREDMFGNRHDQVDAIITNAARRGAKTLRGKRKVKLLITMIRFHALSEKARALLSNSGVHDIAFTAQVVDAKTGKALSPVDTIRADLAAFTGVEADVAEKHGQTQKLRITNHVKNVIAGWLGHGKDVRGTFKRIGR